MSLDKAIKSGKEHRKQYRRSKAWDMSCRNHGGCEWCLGNRTHSNDKRELEATEAIENFKKFLGDVKPLDREAAEVLEENFWDLV